MASQEELITRRIDDRRYKTWNKVHDGLAGYNILC